MVFTCFFQSGNETYPDDLKQYVTTVWKWDKTSIAYKALINPKNILDGLLFIHEYAEVTKLKQIGKRTKNKTVFTLSEYKVAHVYANNVMVKYAKANLKFMNKYTDIVIKKFINLIFDMLYPANTIQEREYMNYYRKRKPTKNEIILYIRTVRYLNKTKTNYRKLSGDILWS